MPSRLPAAHTLYQHSLSPEIAGVELYYDTRIGILYLVKYYSFCLVKHQNL